MESLSIIYGSKAEKPAVVIELGSAYIKFGIASEGMPRHVIRSDVKIPLSADTSDSDLEEQLYRQLHSVYFNHLLFHPKERRVVVCEDLLCTTAFKRALAAVFFRRLKVPSVLFAVGPVLAVRACGKSTALVVECGHSETRVVGICEAVPMPNTVRTLPMGAIAVQDRLKNLLLTGYGQHNTPPAVGDGTGVGAVPPEQLNTLRESLTPEVLEDLRSRGCAVRSASVDISRVSVMAYPLPLLPHFRVPASARICAADVLFEGDDEGKSVATVLLDSLMQVEPQLRTVFISSLVLCGGMAMMPGFGARLNEALVALLQTPAYTELAGLRPKVYFLQPGFPGDCLAWVGGSLLGSLHELPDLSLSQESFLEQPTKLPDWMQLPGQHREVQSAA